MKILQLLSAPTFLIGDHGFFECLSFSRFGYTYLKDGYQKGKAYVDIEKLDRLGMEAIATLDPAAFKAYMDETKNTVQTFFLFKYFKDLREKANLYPSSRH